MVLLFRLDAIDEIVRFELKDGRFLISFDREL